MNAHWQRGSRSRQSWPAKTTLVPKTTENDVVVMYRAQAGDTEFCVKLYTLRASGGWQWLLILEDEDDEADPDFAFEGWLKRGADAEELWAALNEFLELSAVA